MRASWSCCGCLLLLLAAVVCGSGVNRVHHRDRAENRNGHENGFVVDSSTTDQIDHTLELTHPQEFHLDGLLHAYESGTDGDASGTHGDAYDTNGYRGNHHDGMNSAVTAQISGVPWANHEHTRYYTARPSGDGPAPASAPAPYAHAHGAYGHHHHRDLDRQLREERPCADPRQSPISIDTCSAERQLKSTLVFNNFAAFPSSFNITNTGKDAMAFLAWEGRRPPTVSGGRLPGTFKPFAVDFHWGVDDSVGSEHTINGRTFPLEGHIQCHNVKYESVDEALGKVDGLAVVGVLFDLGVPGPAGGPLRPAGRGLTGLAEAFSQIRVLETSAEVTSPPSMASFLPNNVNDYVEYSGSLTSDPYSEVVSWVVMLTPALVLNVELQLFRALRKGEMEPIGNTFRLPQPLCGRKLYRSGLKQLLERRCGDLGRHGVESRGTPRRA